ncbi:MAG: hypothetical protein J6Y02_10790 [Pseudobutyrivibrio sp.]|nr:hypothetical protein [Pseudobutyrivibrio sp.]
MADVYSKLVTYTNCTTSDLPIRTGPGLNNSFTGYYINPGDVENVSKRSGDWVYVENHQAADGTSISGWVKTKSSERTLLKCTSAIPEYTSDKTYNAEESAKTVQAKLNNSAVALDEANLSTSLRSNAENSAAAEARRKGIIDGDIRDNTPYASSKNYYTPTINKDPDDDPEDILAVQKTVDLDKESATKSAMSELRRIGENDFIIQSDLPKEKRFGMFDRVGILDATAKTISTKEYVFFTKPDLHIFDNESDKHGNTINPELVNNPLFVDGFNRYRDVLAQLQSSIHLPNYHYNSPFMNLLSYNIKSTIDLPTISAEDTATSANIYGTAITYRDTSEKSDDGFEFNVEFEDTKYLETYMLFKYYDEYERKKHDGIVSPVEKYITYKILHDQFAVYKIVVGEDGESIVYWAKFYGVYPKGVPRDVMNEVVDNKIRFTVPFKCQFMDDMDPQILTDFNLLTNPNGRYKAQHAMLPIDPETGLGNLRFGMVPFISVDKLTYETATPYERSSMYKLRWIEDVDNVREIRYQDSDAKYMYKN